MLAAAFLGGSALAADMPTSPASSYTVTLGGKAVALHSAPVYTSSETSSIFSQ